MRNDELASCGIRAYQSGQYDVAIDMLTTLMDSSSNLWTCRLYLGMAYHGAGMISQAREQFETIAQWASDQSVKKKALAALRAINATQPYSEIAKKNSGSAVAMQR